MHMYPSQSARQSEDCPGGDFCRRAERQDRRFSSESLCFLPSPGCPSCTIAGCPGNPTLDCAGRADARGSRRPCSPVRRAGSDRTCSRRHNSHRASALRRRARRIHQGSGDTAGRRESLLRCRRRRVHARAGPCGAEPLRVRARAQSESSAGGEVARRPALPRGSSARGDLDLRVRADCSPKNGDLQKQLDNWRKEQELQSRFHEVRTEHFTALFEAATDEPFAREVLARLEAAYCRIGNTLGVYPSQPVSVVLYTREQFGEITRLAAWSAAGYDGRIRVPLGRALEQPEELDRVLSHEYVHAVVAMLGGRTVPGMGERGPGHGARVDGYDRRRTNADAHRCARIVEVAQQLRGVIRGRGQNRLRVGGAGRPALDRPARPRRGRRAPGGFG